ncbi:MAG: sulfurtransferase complex subunit TusB [Candidatus Thorarchaeota archaeon]
MKYLIWLSDVCASIKEVIDALKTQDVETDLLLLQDGVYLVDKGYSQAVEVSGLPVKIHALKDHIEERGIGGRLVVDVNQIEYPEIISLIMEEYDKIISL